MESGGFSLFCLAFNGSLPPPPPPPQLGMKAAGPSCWPLIAQLVNELIKGSEMSAGSCCEVPQGSVPTATLALESPPGSGASAPFP